MTHFEEIRLKGFTSGDGSKLNDNDYIYIDALYQAMEMVEQRYLVDNSPSANAENEVIESSYNSRLVSKMNLFLNENPNYNPYGLDCVGPEKKGIYRMNEESQMNIKYPDIVLHKGNSPLDGFQEIVCEIKRKSHLGSEEMICDLNKLLYFISSITWGNPYRVGAFIVYNCTKAQLESKVKGFHDGPITIESLIIGEENRIMSFSKFVSLYQEGLKNLLCFCHSDENRVELCRVYDIIQSKII